MKNIKFPLSWQILLTIFSAILVCSFFEGINIYLKPIGELFIRFCSLLCFAVIICGSAHSVINFSKSNTLARVFYKNLTFLIINQTIAVGFAFLVSKIFKIGNNQTINEISQNSNFEANTKSFSDYIFNIIPQNFSSLIEDENLLSLMFISVVFGFFVIRCKDKTHNYLKNLFSSFSEVVLNITNFLAKISPIGIFCLVCDIICSNKFKNILSNYQEYFWVTCLIILIYNFVLLPIAFKLVTKSSPFRLLKDFGSIFFTTICLKSTLLSTPFAIERFIKEIKCSEKITFFSMNFLSILNFCGTAIIMTITSIFVINSYAIELNFGEQMLILIAICFVAIGNNIIPIAPTAMLYPVFDVVNLPTESIGAFVVFNILFLSLAQVTNIWSNICATAIIAKTEGESIDIDQDRNKNYQ